MPSNNFFKELKNRKVYRVGITYAIVAWLILQVASVIEPIIDAPNWFMKVVLVLILIGFPIALVLAWAFEMSPDGIILTSSKKDSSNTFVQNNKYAISNKYLIGFLLALVIGQFFYNRYIKSEKNYFTGERLSIAVLPLKNLNGNPDFDFFSNGITQELINELAIIKSFQITPFYTSFLYKESGKKHTEIADELNVDIILSGSVRVFDERVKISVELFDPRTNEMIWNDTFDESYDNAPEIQSSIAMRTAENLNIKLTPIEDESLKKTHTESGMAFRLFLKAKSEILALKVSRLSLGDSLLEEALIIDPGYAQAHTLLAWSNVLQSWSWLMDGKKTMKEKKEKIEYHIQKALEIDPYSSDAYLVRANLSLNIKAKLADARKDVERAIEINSWPKVPTDYCICTAVTAYAVSHMLIRAKELANLAQSVDPGNLFIYLDQRLIHMVDGNYSKALEYALQADKASLGEIHLVNYFVGEVYYHIKDYEKSLEFFLRSLSLEERPSSITMAYVSNVYHQLGNVEKSKEYRQLVEERKLVVDGGYHLSRAIIAAVQEGPEEVLDNIEKSLNAKEGTLSYIINGDPLFKPYYELPRFIDIRKKMQFYN